MKNYLEPKSLLDVHKWKSKASKAIRTMGVKAAHDKAAAGFADTIERIARNRHARHKAA